MAITYTWDINQLECYPQHEGQTDVVFMVHWRRQATDGTYRTEIYGSQGVTLDPDAEFTPFADLTEDQVIGWIETAIGAEQLNAQKKTLDQQIEILINPPIARPPLPWAPSPVIAPTN